MDTTVAAPIQVAVTVGRPPDVAWRVFTQEVASWWPLDTHSVAADSGMAEERGITAVDAIIEPRQGGRFYEVQSNGDTADWGTVTVWEPPSRFAVAWQPNPDRPASTEIEVRFTARGEGTVVELEHRGWERLGDGARAARDSYGAGGGWAAVLSGYAGVVAGSA